MAVTVFRFPIGDLLVEIPELDAITARLDALEAAPGGGVDPTLAARVTALETKATSLMTAVSAVSTEIAEMKNDLTAAGT